MFRRKFTCPFCGSKRIRLVTEKSYVCDNCGKAFEKKK